MGIKMYVKDMVRSCKHVRFRSSKPALFVSLKPGRIPWPKMFGVLRFFESYIVRFCVCEAKTCQDTQGTLVKLPLNHSRHLQDVKLIMEVEPNLIGGLQVEWGYTDPQRRKAPTHGIDLSLKNILGKRALQKGVVKV